MPLDEVTLRFAFLLQGDLRRFVAFRQAHDVHDAEVPFRMLQASTGAAVESAFFEKLATYTQANRALTWTPPAKDGTATYAAVVFREGQARGMHQLVQTNVANLDEQDAATLAQLGALVARADGVHARVVGDTLEYWGIFSRPPPASSVDGDALRFSVPPPAASERPKLETPGAYRSVPPAHEVIEARPRSSQPLRGSAGAYGAWSNLGAAGLRQSAAPSSAARDSARAKKREPSRELFLPVANATLHALTAKNNGYLQGLLIVTIDNDPSRSRPPLVELVIVDAAGMLRSVETPAEVLVAATAMVEADRREGAGAWCKLAARFTPKADGGASLHVDVH
jgi:hypothetical protein